MRIGTVLVITAALACLPGCDPEKCEKNHTGDLSMENTSGDVFVVYAEGDVLGKVYPFEKERFALDVGEYTIEMRREDGAEVCASITVYIDECETEGLCCPECSNSGGGSCPDGYPVDCGDYCCAAGAYCCTAGCCSY